MAAQYESDGGTVWAANNSNAAVAVPLPATRPIGSVLLLVAMCRLITAAAPAPAGYTLLGTFTSATASGGRVWIYAKEVVGGETAPSVTPAGVTGNSGDIWGACLFCYSSVDLSGGIANILDGTPTVTDAAGTTTCTYPAQTIARSDSLLVGLLARFRDAVDTFTPTATWNEREDAGNTNRTGGQIHLQDKVASASGVQAATTVAPSNTTSSRYLAISFALKSQPPVAPVNTVLPSIVSNEPIVENILQGVAGTWSSNAGSIAFSFDWYRDGVFITSVQNYRLVAADVGKTITLRVVGTNSIGSTTAISTDSRIPIPGPVQDIYDQFTRADGPVYAGAGATLWTVERLDWEQTTLMEVKGNALANPGATYEQAVTKGRLGEAGDFDLVLDCTATAASPGEIAIWFCCSGHGPVAAVDGYAFIGSSLGSYWAIRKYVDGVNAGAIAGPLFTEPPIVSGNQIWIAKRGTSFFVRRRANQFVDWILCIGVSDASYSSGAIAIETSDATVRWDNVRGGPWTGLGPPPTAQVVSIL